MEKKIIVYSYWLGMLCAAVAVVWKAAEAMGFFMMTMTGRLPFNYMSLFKGAVLFLIVTIASSAYQSGNR